MNHVERLAGTLCLLACASCASARPAPQPTISYAEFMRRVAAYPDADTSTAAAMVRAQMKDPEAAQFSGVFTSRVYPSGLPVVCGRVNAKNSYGAYVGFTPFIVFAEMVTLQQRYKEKEFQGLWNRSCAGTPKSGDAVTPR